MSHFIRRAVTPSILLSLPFVVASCSVDPTTSYCEALCDWAVTCASGERTVDDAALREQCLTEARAADETCADAEDGKINAATEKLLEPCITAIESAEAALECDGFVGSIDDLKTATTPTACAGQGTDAQTVFDTVRGATAETSEDLCNRFTDTFCVQLDTCIVSAYYPGGEVPKDVTDLTGTPTELCIDNLGPVTDVCLTNSLYEPEDSLDDVNLARQGARECLTGIADISCDDLLAGNIPEFCAASFLNNDDLLTFGFALADTALAFEEAAN